MERSIATILFLILISTFQFGAISSNTIPDQDVSYMKFVHNAGDLPEKQEYDYIIIGGGAAGCPLAATLSSKFKVLLLERGSEPNKYPSVLNEQDISYMKFVHDGNDFPEKEEYDYIIVGGGTAGCPLAATLSKNFSTLLIERGSEPNKYPSVLKEQALLNVFTVEDDGKNPYNRFTSKEGVQNLRGRVLGGTSMINGGVYSKPNTDFFKTQLGVQKFDMEMVEKAYKWVEEALVYRPSLNAWQNAFRRILVEGGIVPDNGIISKWGFVF
ncbi:(R)-mandelonitrile lyase 2, partial [Cucurbita argyrosperma subsp. sororia]